MSKFVTIVNAAMRLLNKSKPYMNSQYSTLPAALLEYSPDIQTVHINHNNNAHFFTSSSIGNKVKIYDSLKTRSTEE